VEAVPADNVMDPMYYRCRSARLSCQKDTLISITVDEPFGKRVIVNSPNIGSLEDHGQIEKTFHGSRVMRGIPLSTNPLVRPTTPQSWFA
jgi:hypothetical protein